MYSTIYSEYFKNKYTKITCFNAAVKVTIS